MVVLVGWASKMPWLSVFVTWRLRRISTREYVENELVKSILKRLFEILNPGVVID